MTFFVLGVAFFITQRIQPANGDCTQTVDALLESNGTAEVDDEGFTIRHLPEEKEDTNWSSCSSDEEVSDFVQMIYCI